MRDRPADEGPHPGHRKPKPPAAKPPPARPSWTLPGPLILTASDPDSANDHAGVGTIGVIVVPGIAPIWRCEAVGGGRVGWLAQVEGVEQGSDALTFLSRMPSSDSRAVIGTLNVPAQPFLNIGVNLVFAEVNAQALPDGSGKIANQLFQGRQDGWPFVLPSFGVYDGVGLRHYLDELAGLPDAVTIGKEWAVFSAEGCGDTGSWPTLAAL